MERVGLRCNPCVVDLTQQHGTAETLTETRITCTKEEKVRIKIRININNEMVTNYNLY